MGYLVLFFTEPNKIDVTMLLGNSSEFFAEYPKESHETFYLE